MVARAAVSSSARFVSIRITSNTWPTQAVQFFFDVDQPLLSACGPKADVQGPPNNVSLRGMKQT